MRPRFAASRSGIEILTLQDPLPLEDARSIIDRHFPEAAGFYTQMALEDYRALVIAAQEAFNAASFARRVALAFRDQLCGILDTRTPYIQTNLYLRATRPIPGATHQEHVGWHRESFYGPGVSECINIWMPLRGVGPENIIRYIPNSHMIPDEDIRVEQVEDPSVPRFSSGHKMGLLYAPKRIVGGVDLENSRKFDLQEGEIAVFAGNLIHGAGANLGKTIRFSVDFRMIAEESLEDRKHHFASGRDYFEPL